MGRTCAHQCVRSRLHQGASRAAAPHEIYGEADRAGRLCGQSEIVMRNSASRLKLLAVAAGILGVPSATLAVVDPGVAVAPRMEFTPPRPGTYRLQKIQPTTDATLLDPSGRPVRLSAETTGKITLLTFFYTYCTDPIGCPLAYRTLLEVRTGVGRVAGLERRGGFLGGCLEPTTHTPAAIGNNRER